MSIRRDEAAQYVLEALQACMARYLDREYLARHPGLQISKATLYRKWQAVRTGDWDSLVAVSYTHLVTGDRNGKGCAANQLVILHQIFCK